MSRARLHLLPRSLVGRIFALYTVVLVGFVATGLGLFYRYQFSVELEEAQVRAEALGEVLLPTVSDSAVIGDYDTIRRTLERAVYHSSFAAVSFIDLRGGAVRVPSSAKAEVEPPAWLRDAVAARLYDSNHAISVGGHDYGVLRLSFAHERIAGRLWAQTRIALLLGLASVIVGLLLIRLPLVRWLGDLGRMQAFEAAMARGEAAPSMLAADKASTEFRQTFEVLGRAAANLQSQRAQAAVTLGAIADGVFTLDLAGRIVLANPAAGSMTGEPEANLSGRMLRQVLPSLRGDDTPLAPWSGRRVELKNREQAVMLDTSLSVILGPDSRPTGYVLACRDVSEQHALDQRLRTELSARESAMVSLRRVLEDLTPEALQEQHDDLAAISTMIAGLVSRLQVRGEQLDAIFELSPDGFISFDAARQVNYVSPAVTRLSGLSAQQLLGASETAVELLLRRQADAQVHWAGLVALRLRGDQAALRRDQLVLVRPQRRVLEIGLRSGSTAVISQVLSLRDVTHETEVDQMKSEFLSTAAHELRTPMASIYGFAELMMHRMLKPEQQQEVAATIHRQSQLMIAIIDELLDLARIEARHGQDFDIQPLELPDFLRACLHDFKPPQSREQPRLEMAALPQAVMADRNKLQQALGNVLSNAFKYSPQGGAVLVRVVHRAHDISPVGIEVQDQGIGMTAAQLARVSERFYRADASGNIPGTGLGMSIVREIIELLGGELALRSVAQQGTVVTLWLPVAASEQVLETV